MRHVFALLLATATAAVAHVGSPDIFFEGAAGPYRLLVTIRPPAVIPGVAEIEVRSAQAGVAAVEVVPLSLKNPRYGPTPDRLQRSLEDPQFFTGSLWMMQTGNWQVRVTAAGARGKGELAVPVPAVSSRVATMQKTTGAVLVPLGLLLSLGIVSIVGAGVREGQLEPGAAPDGKRVRRARITMGATALVVLAALSLGNQWWDSEAGWYRRYVFKPLQLNTKLESGGLLLLQLRDPGWLSWRKVGDLIPDHGHLMHLYVIRLPEMERVWHLHPREIDDGTLVQQLPAMPAGEYQLYGDIVHETGLPETVVTKLRLPAVAGQPLAGDDAAGAGPPLSRADAARTSAPLPDGGRMVWERDAAIYKTRRPHWFRFRVEDANGKPAGDLELYMGMPGHAAFVRTDLSVFAHVHPSGTVPMAALSLVAGADPHAGHHMALDSVVSFPYGFPQAGAYRIFVQVKRAGRVETGIFDVKVEN